MEISIKIAEIISCYVYKNIIGTMEIITKRMLPTKIPLINLMTTIYFNNHQKQQLVDFLKKYPGIIYAKHCPDWEFQVYTRIKPVKVSVRWHWNSVNVAIMLLPRDVSNNFTKTMFSLRDIIKIVSDQ